MHSHPSPPATVRPRLDVADVFRAHGEAYRAHHVLSPTQRKAMWAIEHCRTEALGGHLDVCTACGDERPSYNSCRNRHCPKCQAVQQAQWLDGRMKRILPTHYFHVVFTLPSELRPLARRNPVALYNLLFEAASQTLLAFGRNELGAQLGFTAVLHTWTRELLLHPHLHCIVTGGGLDEDGARWVPTAESFLFPVKAMNKCFRGKFLDGLRRLYQDGSLALDGLCAKWVDPKAFARFIDGLYRVKWVVYCKSPFGGPEEVFAYLGRYTHRVAISNSRLVEIDDEHVRFKTRDGGHASLSPGVFLGRFLLHILPPRFVKIRHYGLMSSGNATRRLEVARTCLLTMQGEQATTSANGPVIQVEEPRDWRAWVLKLTGIDPLVCPRCGGLRVRRPLPACPSPGPRNMSAPVHTQDTS